MPIRPKMTAGKPRVRKSSAVARVAKPSRALTSAVKKVMARTTETKFVAKNIAVPYVVPQTASLPVSGLTIIPPVIQGTADWNRIGDNIRPSSIRCKLGFFFDRAEPSTNAEYEVNVLVVTCKSVKDELLQSQLPPNALFRVGDGTTTDPTDRPSNIAYINRLPINTDAFTLLHHKRFVMRKNAGLLQDQPFNPPVNTTTPYDGSKGTYHRLDFTVKTPEFKYAQQVSNTPSNFAPFMLVWATAVDGGLHTNPPAVNMVQSYQMYYKDV